MAAANPGMIDRLKPRHFQQFRSPYGRSALAGLEALRRAAGYIPNNQVIPDQQHVSLASLATWDHQITVSRGSWIYAISGSTEQPEGYTVQLTDLLTKRNVFSGPIQIENVAPQSANNPSISDSAGNLVTVSNPVAVFPIPRPVEILNVQLKNLSQTPNTVQLVLWILEPTGDAPNNWNAELQAAVDTYHQGIYGTPEGIDIANANAAPTIDDELNKPAYHRAYRVYAAGDNIIVPGVPGRRISIHCVSLYNSTEQNIGITDGQGGDALTGPFDDFGVGGGYFLPNQRDPHFVLTDGRAFVINLTAAAATPGIVGAVSGFVKYRLLTQWTPGQ